MKEHLFSEVLEVELCFLEPILGSVPKSKEVYSNFIKTKAPGIPTDERTLEDPDMDELEAKGWTTFYVNEEGKPILMDYQIKGFLKEWANVLKDEFKIKNMRSKVEQCVFVMPRQTVLADSVMDAPLERPLRALTRQGERVFVARSDMVPAGTRIKIKIGLLPNPHGIGSADIITLLDYGSLKGIGQFRNGGYGRFTCEVLGLTRPAAKQEA